MKIGYQKMYEEAMAENAELLRLLKKEQKRANGFSGTITEMSRFIRDEQDRAEKAEAERDEVGRRLKAVSGMFDDAVGTCDELYKAMHNRDIERQIKALEECVAEHEQPAPGPIELDVIHVDCVKHDIEQLRKELKK